jgi:Tol biopolymer transport system component
VVQRELPEAHSVLPIAWSADGSQVAYLSREQPTNPYSAGPGAGDLFVLDLESGDAEPVPGGGGASTAAFSPDGRQVPFRFTAAVLVALVCTLGAARVTRRHRSR